MINHIHLTTTNKFFLWLLHRRYNQLEYYMAIIAGMILLTSFWKALLVVFLGSIASGFLSYLTIKHLAGPDPKDMDSRHDI